MAKLANQLVCIIGFLLCFAMCARADWCVAVTGAPDDKVQAFLDYACGNFDCGPIKEGGACYEPNTYQNHGSFALDLVYRTAGSCEPTAGTVTPTDPSYGDCKYP